MLMTRGTPPEYCVILAIARLLNKRVGRAGDPQAIADVLLDLGGVERPDPAMRPDRIAKVLEVRMIEPGLELGWPHEQDLQSPAGGRALEVREHAELRERQRIEALRLVDDERGALAGPLTLAQEAVQGGEPPRGRLLGLRDAQVLEQELDDPFEG
jgi:hypothetical protein